MKFFDQTLDVIQARQAGVDQAVAAIEALMQRASAANAASENLSNFLASNNAPPAISAKANDARAAALAWNNAAATWRAAQDQVALLMGQNAEVTAIAAAQAAADNLSGDALNAAAYYAALANSLAAQSAVLMSPAGAQASSIAKTAVDSAIAGNVVSKGIAQLPINADPDVVTASAAQGVVDAAAQAAQAATQVAHQVAGTNHPATGTIGGIVDTANSTLNSAGQLGEGGFSGRTVAIGLAALLAISLLRR